MNRYLSDKKRSPGSTCLQSARNWSRSSCGHWSASGASPNWKCCTPPGTALGRTHLAAETWRRFLTLATNPELVQSAFNGNFGDGVDAAEIIDRVKAKLAALTASGDQ